MREREDVQPGNFCVDWDANRLYVWLPGDLDPNASEVLGASRGYLFGPRIIANKLVGAEYITVKGLTFRYAANFAQRNMVRATTGWRLEDCTFEWANGGGFSTEGEDIAALRCTFQDNGEAGLGGTGKNLLFQDCIVRRNNWKGFPPSNEGGACKFVGSDGVRVVNVQSYSNTGPGWWFDWDNTNFEITGCTFYGNRGLQADWEGNGIFIEASQGPGRITNNVIYSNTGAGIALAESQNLTVENNLLADNGSGFDLRAMEGRAQHKLENITIKNNRFKGWRSVALATSLGTWNANSPADKKLQIEGNVYDPTPGKFFARWANQDLKGLDDFRALLNLETTGRFDTVPFDRALVDSRTVATQKKLTIDDAVAKAKVGDVITIPVNGRGALNDDQVQVFDLSNRYVMLSLPNAEISRAIETKIAPYPLSESVLLRVKLTNISPATEMTGEAIGFEK